MHWLVTASTGIRGIDLMPRHLDWRNRISYIDTQQAFRLGNRKPRDHEFGVAAEDDRCREIRRRRRLYGSAKLTIKMANLELHPDASAQGKPTRTGSERPYEASVHVASDSVPPIDALCPKPTGSQQ